MISCKKMDVNTINFKSYNVLLNGFMVFLLKHTLHLSLHHWKLRPLWEGWSVVFCKELSDKHMYFRLLDHCSVFQAQEAAAVHVLLRSIAALREVSIYSDSDHTSVKFDYHAFFIIRLVWVPRRSAIAGNCKVFEITRTVFSCPDYVGFVTGWVSTFAVVGVLYGHCPKGVEVVR